MASDNPHDDKIGRLGDAFTPSKFMRELRPELYSDTEDKVAYVLERPVLEYYLETLTSRNETHDFEVFCRKLCERTICSNLRPPTGPEGGGDSKADSETIAVSEEISDLYYVGLANSGTERWAFAFSAKKTWIAKARGDVEGIVGTGRAYTRIYVVTARFAKAKQRAQLEDELTQKHSVKVTILDRSWIVDEVVEKGRKDLAINYLNVGEVKRDPFRLGPKDYSREQQLADLENQLADPTAYQRMESHRVVDALVAAKLSRALEKPRTETDGRFARAVRLADKYGAFHQKVEARYEQIWGAFWWFDDADVLLSEYDAFERMVIDTEHSSIIDHLGTLHQLLYNTAIRGHKTREECRLEERTKRLNDALTAISQNEERPNNALDAEVQLLIIKMNICAINNDSAGMDQVWEAFRRALVKAKGLSEFDFRRIEKLVDVAGAMAGNSKVFSELVDELSEFVSTRKSEAEGALILLKRASRLDLNEHFEITRLAGKAAIRLTKKEYTEDLGEALRLLMIAYRSAGLLWAARAGCIYFASTIMIEHERAGKLPQMLIPVMHMLAWITLELKHLPDFLLAVQLFNGVAAASKLSDEAKQDVEDKRRNLDGVLGSVILNLKPEEIEKLEILPDVLEGLGLQVARTALMYALGYEEDLRADGSIPKEEAAQSAADMMSWLASQPAARQVGDRPLITNDGSQTYSTDFVGVKLTVESAGDEVSGNLAEMLLSALEAFFCTVLEKRIAPHTERVQIRIEIVEEGQPKLKVDRYNYRLMVQWPKTISVRSYASADATNRFIMEVCAAVLGTAFMVSSEEHLESLFKDDVVHHRISLAIAAVSSYSRFTGSNISTVSEWKDRIGKEYPLKTDRPKIKIVDLSKNLSRKSPGDGDGDVGAKPIKAIDHREVRTLSVIDVHAWDKAKWRGTVFATIEGGDPVPPALGLFFENKSAANNIFQRWRERFGEEDIDSNIYLSVTRNIPGISPHHYVVVVSSRPPRGDEFKPGQNLILMSRGRTMEPADSRNYDRFIKAYEASGRKYVLMPAFPGKDGSPVLNSALMIAKVNLVIKNAKDIQETDPEALVIPEIADEMRARIQARMMSE